MYVVHHYRIHIFNKCPLVAYNNSWPQCLIQNFTLAEQSVPVNNVLVDIPVFLGDTPASSSGAAFFAQRWPKTRVTREWLMMKRKGLWERENVRLSDASPFSPSRLPLCENFHRERDVWVRGRTNGFYLDTVLSDSTQRISPTFDKLNEIEQDRWSLKRCELIFCLLSSKNFATMATWRNDYSSLLVCAFYKLSPSIRIILFVPRNLASSSQFYFSVW